jgi:2-oxoacid:acceptor oxidoreductase gamma subunit (pyruvate/2-ketoisovalerate family)
MGKTAATEELTYPLEIRWHGRGGQGAVTASKLLAETALDLGKHVQAFPQFGSERRGAPIIAFTRIDERPITLYNTIAEPNVVIVLDESLLELPMVMGGLREEGLLLVDSSSTPGQLRERLNREKGRVATVAASAIATEHLGRPVTNTAMLGAFLAATGVLELERVLAHVQEKFSRQFSASVVTGNLKAMREAHERVRIG